jgi:hypothetical protein
MRPCRERWRTLCRETRSKHPRIRPSVRQRSAPSSRILQRGPFWFLVGVVAVQSVHMFEHVLQLIQVMAWNVPDDEALGLLGHVFQLQGTEEWMHLFFNLALLTSLWLLLGPIRAASPSTVPRWAFLVYLFGAVGLETWHQVEHLVIIFRVVMNKGCPCPGIGDAVLGVTDTVLQFIYNGVVYAAMLVPFWFVVREPGGTRPGLTTTDSTSALIDQPILLCVGSMAYGRKGIRRGFT